MIGCEDEKGAVVTGEDEVEPEEDVFSSLAPESPEEILTQVSTLNSSKDVYNSKISNVGFAGQNRTLYASTVSKSHAMILYSG